MNDLVCEHCGGKVKAGEITCTHCGMPLPPDLGKTPQRKFILFFIALIFFCAAMILWLPPDWTHFIQ